MIDHGEQYEHTEKGRPLIQLLDIDFLAAMPPPSGGRNPVSQRLLRHFNIQALGDPKQAVLERIFLTRMDLHLKSKDAVDEPLAPVFRSAIHASIAVL